MDVQVAAAYALAKDLSVELITISLAVLGISVTLMKDFKSDARIGRILLITAWGLFAISAIVGVITLLALMGALEFDGGAKVDIAECA